MALVLIATDSDAVADDVIAALDDGQSTFKRVRRGFDVVPAVKAESFDLAVLDLQIGNMGGMAACMDIRHEEGANRIDLLGTLMLLDREADIFLAKRAGADGWLVKPLDSVRLRAAATAIIDGGVYHEAASAETIPAT